MTSVSTQNNKVFKLPKDINILITNFCSGSVLANLRTASKEFMVMIDSKHNFRLQCFFLERMAVFCNNHIIKQASEVSLFDYGITNIKQYELKKISMELWSSFSKAIQYKTDKDLKVLYPIFKENVLDALSQVADFLPLPQKNPSLNELIYESQTREVGNVFIIPNPIRIVGTDSNDYDKHSDFNGRKHGNYGISGDLLPCVQTWIKSKYSHHWSEKHPIFGEWGIDEYLPIALFLGKKEGDTVCFNFKSKLVKLFCTQLPYKYGFHNFEEMLSHVSSQGDIRPTNSFHPPISEETQRTIIQQSYLAHTLALANLNKQEESH